MEYVIIGGDAAGMSAAMQIWKYNREANITVLEKGTTYSYGQCGLPYVVSGDIPSTDDLIARSAEQYRGKFGINALVQHEAIRVDAESKIVTARNLTTNEMIEFPYDKLLVASGGHAHVPTWEGVSLNGVHVLKDIPDAQHILDYLTDEIKDVTVIGGGYIGLEMVDAFKMRGRNVRLINRSAYAGKIFDEDMAAYIQEEAEKHQVEFITNENTLNIQGREAVEAVQTDKAKYATDLVLIATGLRPNINFLSQTNVAMADNGAVKVNNRMETNVAGVYAAGDCAMQYHRVKEGLDYIPLGTTANKQGRIAGMNMVDVDRTFKGVTGTSILKFMDLSLGKTGLSDKEASDLDIPYASVKIQATDIAGYYPNPSPIHVKITYRTDTFRLLGGQVIGRNGVDKRIDVLATALFNQMTVDQLEDLDLAYAPPFNGVWDPIQKAARRANK